MRQTFSTYKPLLAIVTGLLVLYAFSQLIGFFYNIFVLLGLSVLLAYILIGPVRLVEKALLWCSSVCFSSRNNWYSRLIQRTPAVNPRIGAVIMVYFSFFLVCSLAIMRFGPVIITQVEEFTLSLPVYIAQGESTTLEWLNRYISSATIKQFFNEDIQAARKRGRVITPSKANEPISEDEKQIIQQTVMKSGLNGLTGFLEKTLVSSLNHAIDILTGTFNGIIYLLSGLTLVFYFLMDAARIKTGLLNLLPADIRPTGDYILDRAHEVMWGFIKGQVFIGLFTGSALFLTYTFFNVKYAAFLGVLLGISELVPMIGTWFGQAMAYTVILSGPAPWMVVPVWLCSHAYMMIKDNIIMPRIVGNVMGLHPVTIIASIIFCTEIMGIIGVVLAIPLASLSNVLIHHFIIQQDYEAVPEGAS